MAKSIRSKREKRLRAIRREIVKKEPFYENKEAAKLAAQEAALSAPKLPVKTPKNDDSVSMIEGEVAANATTSALTANTMDMDTDEGDKNYLKPTGGIGKKMKKKIKIAKKKSRGKGKIRRKNI
ncbi:uncharacterized protein LOC124912128 [Impatiens glandulifera]|uniref:uncharacterized protein LOC124912128 n=1 Tax=Impatiens glandulifera TaxID=253017 RepID=UPI001FB0B4D4|nr:uncharacterized protein LOC124912128 [Impatiens glandulifera]